MSRIMIIEYNTMNVLYNNLYFYCNRLLKRIIGEHL